MARMELQPAGAYNEGKTKIPSLIYIMCLVLDGCIERRW